MKKKIISLALGAMMAISVGCFAKIPAAQIALGGIEPGFTIEQVKQVCGEPTYNGGDTLVFGDLVVKVDDDRPGIVEEVIVRGGNIATPAGIKVGMSESALNEAYGRADDVDRDTNDTEYTYKSDDGKKKLEFKVVNGVIVKIKCELRD